MWAITFVLWIYEHNSSAQCSAGAQYLAHSQKCYVPELHPRRCMYHFDQWKAEKPIVIWSSVCQWNAKFGGIWQVHYDTLVLGPRDILTAIQELGYTVQLAEEAANTLSEGAAVRQKEIRFWRRKFWAGFVLSVPIVLLTMVFQMIPATEKGLEASLQGFTAGELAKWALSTPVLVSLQAWINVACHRQPNLFLGECSLQP